MTPTSTGLPGWQLGSVGLHQWQLQYPSEPALFLSSPRGCSDALANPRLNAPHSAVTALAQGGGRRAARARLNTRGGRTGTDGLVT